MKRLWIVGALVVVAVVAVAGTALATKQRRSIFQGWFSIVAPGPGFIDVCEIEATYQRKDLGPVFVVSKSGQVYRLAEFETPEHDPDHVVEVVAANC